MSDPAPTAVLAVDVGGTFTDIVIVAGDALLTGKVPSTPQDQSIGVVDGAGEVAAGIPGEATIGRFLHGTTVATNALLERKGAVVALLTTAGFEDVVEIGRQDRPSLYDPFADRPEPLVTRERRIGVPRDGAVALEGADLAGVEAVAVSLLDAYAQPEREREVLQALRATPGSNLPVTLSSEVVAEFREYERTSTAVLNAYLMPVTGRYLERLVSRARDAGLPGDIAVMRSSGGLLGAAAAARLPAAVLLSGPAGGVVAAAAVGRALDRDHLISFDMGGTSTDVCRIDHGLPEVTYERAIEGYACKMPSVAIHTVGAGGGSIAWVDAGGSLRVGPQSAGAEPGPACYRRGGTLPTVTDANVVLGRIASDARLGDRLEIDAAAARQVVGELGDRLGIDAESAALGISAVVEEVMAGAIRKVSIEQGADPRHAMLVAFGGAGGLHATALARRLRMAGVIVPPYAGVFSALGLSLSPPRVDVARTVMLDAAASGRLDVEVEAIAAAARAEFATFGDPGEIRTKVDVRYVGQSHEIAVDYRPGDGWARLAAAFHEAHRRRNGFARPGDPIEAVTVRAEAIGAPATSWERLPRWEPEGPAVIGSRPVVTASGEVLAQVVHRHGLAPGDVVSGPAVIEEAEATTWLDVGDTAEVHGSGALVVTWEQRPDREDVA